MSDETRKRHFGSSTTTTELGNKAAEGAGVGGAVGGTVGAIAAIAAIGTSLVIPGLGIVIAGPAAAALAGAGAGAAAGGIVGALVGWGIPEERVKHYEAGIKKGGILMGVRPRSDEDAKYFSRIGEPTAPSTSTHKVRTARTVAGVQPRRGLLPMLIKAPCETLFRRKCAMNNIIYIVGLVVIILAVLGWLGLR